MTGVRDGNHGPAPTRWRDARNNGKINKHMLMTDRAKNIRTLKQALKQKYANSYKTFCDVLNFQS